jgi:hypothetical protein
MYLTQFLDCNEFTQNSVLLRSGFACCCSERVVVDKIQTRQKFVILEQIVLRPDSLTVNEKLLSDIPVGFECICREKGMNIAQTGITQRAAPPLPHSSIITFCVTPFPLYASRNTSEERRNEKNKTLNSFLLILASHKVPLNSYWISVNSRKSILFTLYSSIPLHSGPCAANKQN